MRMNDWGKHAAKGVTMKRDKKRPAKIKNSPPERIVHEAAK